MSNWFKTKRISKLLAPVAAVACFSPLPASGEIFEGLPDLIVCNVEIPSQGRSGRVIFYLDSEETGRVTRYTSLGAAPMQIQVLADGTVSDNNLADCTGKTIPELRKSDQAFDFE